MIRDHLGHEILVLSRLRHLWGRAVQAAQSPRRVASFMGPMAALVVTIAFGPASHPKPATVTDMAMHESWQASELPVVFARVNFDLESVRRGKASVPRLFFAQLPSDYAGVVASSDRKEVFVKTLLPLILKVNEHIRQDRQKLQAILGRVRAEPKADIQDLVPQDDYVWLRDLAHRYGVSSPDRLEELLGRVDEVPPSLALAQGIVESGWGTATLAQQKNSPFGYRTLSDDGTRLRLHHFKTLPDAVRAYVHNINTHRAYARLRKTRAQLRRSQGHAVGLSLAAGLEAYSELGANYVQRLRRVIEQNHLSDFDAARLARPDRPVTLLAV